MATPILRGVFENVSFSAHGSYSITLVPPQHSFDKPVTVFVDADQTNILKKVDIDLTDGDSVERLAGRVVEYTKDKNGKCVFSCFQPKHQEPCIP